MDVDLDVTPANLEVSVVALLLADSAGTIDPAERRSDIRKGEALVQVVLVNDLPPPGCSSRSASSSAAPRVASPSWQGIQDSSRKVMASTNKN
jgi:hypothetical protein